VEIGHFKKDYPELWDSDDSMQFEVALEDYNDAGALMVSCLEEEEGGVDHPENSNICKLTLM